MTGHPRPGTGPALISPSLALMSCCAFQSTAVFTVQLTTTLATNRSLINIEPQGVCDLLLYLISNTTDMHVMAVSHSLWLVRSEHP